MRTLLIGGARSGKSGLASRWADERSSQVCTVVTGTESDPEMAARIAAHRLERPAHWRVREEAVRLGAVLREEMGAGAGRPSSDVAADGGATGLSVPAPVVARGGVSIVAPAGGGWLGGARGGPGLVLVDCLTLWISNCLWPPGREAVDAAGWRRERDDFLDALRACTGEVIIVTNEVGTGIVPNNAASRIFRDEQGWLNQAVAAVCDEVFFVTAGLPLCLKPAAPIPGHTAKPPR